MPQQSQSRSYFFGERRRMRCALRFGPGRTKRHKKVKTKRKHSVLKNNKGKA
jgi:hypothetical protein